MTWERPADNAAAGGNGVSNPSSDDGQSLGEISTPLRWSDLFIASGGVINWDSGNATLTHAAGALTVGVTSFSVGGNFNVTTGNIQFDPTVSFQVNMDASQLCTFSVADDTANAFRIRALALNYLVVTTTNAAEIMMFGNATDNPDYNFLGSGGLGFYGATPAAQAAAPTAQDATVIDATYGSDEEGVINNNRIRIAEIMTALQDLGLIAT